MSSAAQLMTRLNRVCGIRLERATHPSLPCMPALASQICFYLHSSYNPVPELPVLTPFLLRRRLYMHEVSEAGSKVAEGTCLHIDPAPRSSLLLVKVGDPTVHPSSQQQESRAVCADASPTEILLALHSLSICAHKHFKPCAPSLSLTNTWNIQC